MKHLYSRIALFFALVFATTSFAAAANYYWRAVAVNNLFSNIANWETAPGNGISPSTAPSINDDVFFPVPSNFGGTSLNPILLNNSNCRDFNVTSTTGNFNFSGILTAINGSILCPNGNAVFNFGADQDVTGSGTHTINLGTPVDRIISGRLMFVNSAGTGSYTLTGPLICKAGLSFTTQNFNSNGQPITCRRMAIQGTTPKTLDFSNSTIILANDGNGATVDFTASHTTTTYIFTNSQLIFNLTTSSQASGISISPAVNVNLNQVTFNSDALSRKIAYINVPVSAALTANLGINLLQLNTANLALGLSGFDNTHAGANCHGNINIGTLEYLKPNTIATDRSYSMNVGAIIEHPACAGQSAMVCNSFRRLDLITTAPLTTSTIAFSGVNFGGSGLTSSSSNDLGNNVGTVTWTAPLTGQTFWWVGAAGNWDDPTQWSILGSGGAPQASTGCLPTLNDDVVIDANSFTGLQTISLGLGNAFCKNFSWTGSNQGSLTGGLISSSGIFSGNMYVNGNADYAGARAVNANLFFIGSGNHTLNSMTFAPFTSFNIRFMGTGTYTLTNNFVGTTNSSIKTYLQHTAGTFNTAGFVVDMANFCSKSLPEVVTNPRVLTVTNSEFNIRSSIGAGGRRTIDLSFLSALNAAGSNFKLHSTDVTTSFIVTRGDPSLSFLSPATFHDITFTSPSCTPLFSTVGTNYVVNYHDVSFASNGNIALGNNTITHTVNNYNFTSGYTYAFTSGTMVFNVLGAINTTMTGCEELVRIQSITPGQQARINKAAGAFNVNGAIVADINSVGQTMNVVNGVNALGITNVVITPGTARTMYWVNGAGAWSNGLGHWSIGASGGNPALNNPLGCIPRAVDDVIFDLNSFTGSAQAVNLDVDGNCRNMLWTSAAGSLAPVVTGVVSQNLNVYGSMELGAGMTTTFPGMIYMLGTSPTTNMQSIDLNGVTLKANIVLNGGGRYDLLDSVRITTSGNGVKLQRGNLVTNGHKIYASGVVFDVRGANAADIRNSKIQLFATGVFIGSSGNVSYTAFHDGLGGWLAAGSDIQSDADRVVISNTVPITYGKVTMNSLASSADVAGSATQRVFFDYIDWKRVPPQSADGSLLDGVFTIDTLRYPSYSYNTLEGAGARSYTIVDTLIIGGSPCTPSFLRAATAGTPAKLNTTKCNFDFKFVNLRDINATTCTPAQNRSIGVNEGGNTNWSVTGIGAITPLGNDTAIVCGATPFNISASGFGSVPGMTYLWNTGATASTLSTTAAGTYSVVVTYAPGCTATDNLVVTCTPPLPATLTALQGSVQGPVNQLDWSTLDEPDLAAFVVERSGDGFSFAPIGNVAATGSPQQGKAYDFADVQPLDGLQYYRLRLQGRNGAMGFSNTVAITRTAAGAGIACYPNPTQGSLTLDAQGLGSDLVATFYNGAGQPVATYSWGSGAYTVDLSQLPSALYTVAVRDAQGTRTTTRVQVQR